MHVFGFVGVGVVVPMMRGPPDRTALHGGCADHAKDKLADARGLEGAMREIPVVKPGDGEHAHEVGKHRDEHGHGTPADPDDRETGQVHADEGQNPRPLNFIWDLG